MLFSMALARKENTNSFIPDLNSDPPLPFSTTISITLNAPKLNVVSCHKALMKKRWVRIELILVVFLISLITISLHRVLFLFTKLSLVWHREHNIGGPEKAERCFCIVNYTPNSFFFLWVHIVNVMSLMTIALRQMPLIFTKLNLAWPRAKTLGYAKVELDTVTHSKREVPSLKENPVRIEFTRFTMVRKTILIDMARPKLFFFCDSSSNQTYIVLEGTFLSRIRLGVFLRIRELVGSSIYIHKKTKQNKTK